MIDEKTRGRIRAAIARGDTQAEVAKRYGVGPTTVSTLVRDTTRPANMFARTYHTEATVREADARRAKESYGRKVANR